MKGKQIEEITKDLKENLRFYAGVKLLDYQVEIIAYELSKKYQPKLPEHSVVLSRKQCAEMVQDNYNIGYERGGKEMAEKIYKEYLCNILSLEAKEEFIKQFGIEIKE